MMPMTRCSLLSEIGISRRPASRAAACACSSTKEQSVADAVGSRRAVKCGSSCTRELRRDELRDGGPDWCSPHEVRRLKDEGGEAEGEVEKAERSLGPNAPGGDLGSVCSSSRSATSRSGDGASSSESAAC